MIGKFIKAENTKAGRKRKLILFIGDRISGMMKMFWRWFIHCEAIHTFKHLELLKWLLVLGVFYLSENTSDICSLDRQKPTFKVDF